MEENVFLATAERTDLVQAFNCLQISGPQSFASPKGLQMGVHPDSGQLFGAEIQRLSLARALYRNPAILFLDEAASVLDAEAEREISKVLDALRDPVTITLIAHRLSTA